MMVAARRNEEIDAMIKNILNSMFLALFDLQSKPNNSPHIGEIKIIQHNE